MESQVSVPEHTAHEPPLLPQAVLVVPGLQVLPLQQPLGQEAAVQTHCPFEHSWVAPQGTHAAPVRPHFLPLLGGLTQVLPSQQPPWQLLELQVVLGVSHCRLVALQAWPLAHF